MESNYVSLHNAPWPYLLWWTCDPRCPPPPPPDTQIDLTGLPPPLPPSLPPWRRVWGSRLLPRLREYHRLILLRLSFRWDSELMPSGCCTVQAGPSRNRWDYYCCTWLFFSSFKGTASRDKSKTKDTNLVLDVLVSPTRLSTFNFFPYSDQLVKIFSILVKFSPRYLYFSVEKL